LQVIKFIQRQSINKNALCFAHNNIKYNEGKTGAVNITETSSSY